jgi:hypothetical protein
MECNTRTQQTAVCLRPSVGAQLLVPLSRTRCGKKTELLVPFHVSALQWFSKSWTTKWYMAFEIYVQVHFWHLPRKLHISKSVDISCFLPSADSVCQRPRKPRKHLLTNPPNWVYWKPFLAVVLYWYVCYVWHMWYVWHPRRVSHSHTMWYCDTKQYFKKQKICLTRTIWE